MHRFRAAALFLAVAISQRYLPVIGGDRDYVILNEQIDPIPLPFQACVYRRTFQNRTDHPLKTPYPEHGAVIREIWTAETGRFRMPRGSIEDAGRDTGYWLWLAAGARLLPLTLGPGEQASITYSLAGEWLATDAVSALFPEAGTYTFRLYYDDELTIVVHEPRGDDKLIVDQLRANPELAAAMISCASSPPEEMLPRLERIVKLYPESSYADYARYALARHYGNPPLGGTFRDVSDDHKINVGELLKRIDASFAFAPNALVLRHQILKSQGRDDAAAETMKALRENYPDSAEFLNHLAREISDDEWIAQNPRRPTPIPDEPEPQTPRP